LDAYTIHFRACLWFGKHAPQAGRVAPPLYSGPSACSASSSWPKLSTPSACCYRLWWRASATWLT
jgi:hypothetical protein